MLDALDITEAEAAGLSELAALDLASAKEFAAWAQVVDDPKLACELARTSQRYARSYRQILLLKVRLKREMLRAAAETPPPPQEIIHVARDAQRIRARVDALRTPLRRVIWSEHAWTEPPEAEEDDLAGYWFDQLEYRLDRLMRDNAFGLTRLDEHTFGETPLDEHVADIARELGLDEVRVPSWRDLPDPPPEAFIDWGDEDDDSS